MLKPLKQWLCDGCGEVIESPEQGCLEWLWNEDDDSKAHCFRIVHLDSYSPHKSSPHCYHYEDQWNRADGRLDRYVGGGGLTTLLAFLDHDSCTVSTGPRVTDVRELVEIIRRLHVPYYEEARRHFRKAITDGLLDGWGGDNPTPGSMKLIIEKYSSQPA
jgi:hypothetical protein